MTELIAVGLFCKVQGAVVFYRAVAGI
jgi:hypothetical protein